MLPGLPIQTFLIFILTTALTLGLFYWVLSNAKGKTFSRNHIILAVISWLFLQGILANSLFYTKNLDVLPPRFILVVFPIIVTIILVFTTKKGKAFADSLPLLQMTWLNIIRIPVEVGLYWLALDKAIPEIMTFAGRNFDIIGGVTAPFVAYFGIQKGMMSRKALLIWNIAMAGLLTNIVFTALLSAPTPLQQFGFDQPNLAVLHFPYIWLAAFMAPLVLFFHFVSIRQLWK